MAANVNPRGITVDGWVKILLAFTIFCLGATGGLLRRYADSVIDKVSTNTLHLVEIDNRLWLIERDLAVLETDIRMRIQEGSREDFNSRADRNKRQESLEGLVEEVSELKARVRAIEQQ